MAIQLLISDLDGTLLGLESVITPGTAAALEQARQAGLRLLVTTGRAWGTAAPLLQQAGVSSGGTGAGGTAAACHSPPCGGSVAPV